MAEGGVRIENAEMSPNPVDEKPNLAALGGETNNSFAIQEAKSSFGNVERLIEEADIYFLHAISAERRQYGATLNKAFKPNATWEDRLKKVIDDKPEIATSTLKYGKTIKARSPLGVVINGGQVEFADAGDLGSVVDHAGKRLIADKVNPKNVAEYMSQLDVAKAGSGLMPGHPYNEVGISHPAIAGIYVNLDSQNIIREQIIQFDTPVEWPGVVEEGDDQMSIEQMFYVAQDYGMKVFLLEGGKMFEGEYDEKGQLLRNRELTPKDMLREHPDLNLALPHEATALN